jgi:tetratricopeptide (TPR) repeat protein
MGMPPKRFLIALLVLLCSAPLVRGQLSEDYRFQGKVIDQHGKPIPTVRVTLHDSRTGTRLVFETDEDGTFDRRMIPLGVYDLTVEKPGYVPYLEHFDWSADSPQTVIKIAQIVLESEADRARKALGEKAAKLYEDAYAALVANDFQTARKKAEALLELGAGDYEYAVRFVIARSQAMQGEVDLAKAEYGRVLGLKPDLFEAHFDLAGLYERQGKTDDALREYRRAGEINPTDAETQYDLGVIYMKEKQDYEQARVHLAEALKLDPNHVQAIKALGLLNLWSAKPDVAEGMRLLKRYLELQPQAPDTAEIREILESFEPAAPTK